MKLILPLLMLMIIAQNIFGQFQNCNSSTNHRLYDVLFIDEIIGIAVGDSGTIVRSSDGGINWNTVMSNDTLIFKKVKFFDTMNGIAVGSDIYITADAGLNWSIVPYSNNQYYDVEILNQTSCILSGEPTALIKSTDKGLSFSILVEEQTINSLYGLLSFVDENVGYACTIEGGFSTRTLKTNDGGINWTMVEDTNSQPNPTVMEAMSFISEDIGFKAGWYNNHLQKTTNGALDWIDASFGDSLAYPQIIDIHIMANQPNAYYNCGWYGEIFKSTDGGNNWFQLNSGLSNTTSLYGIFFINDTVGWAVGQYGTIIKTNNGGLVTGIDEDLNQSNFKIFPNPTAGLVNIKNEGNYKIEAIDLLTINGQYIKSFEKGKPINLRNQPNGLYILKIESNQGIHTEKILKE